MPARVIDGKAIAKALRVAIKTNVQALTASHGRPPALGLIMVGARQDSALYVKTKHRACHRTGIRSENFLFAEDVAQDQVLARIDALNRDPTIDGILVQLPLPAHLDSQCVIDRIHPSKDVDGLHPFNVGELAMRHRYPFLVPCTAKGIIALLDAEQVPLQGRTAVVLGRSNLVGNPISLMLQKRDATVIQCHSKSTDLPRYLRQADIVIAACGQPYLVRGEWLKPGATVIDVGINFVEAASKSEQEEGEKVRAHQEHYHGQANADGFKIVGDVAFEEARAVAGAITPVPGGVGPMTIAMLLHNVVAAFERHAMPQDDSRSSTSKAEEVATSDLEPTSRDSEMSRERGPL